MSGGSGSQGSGGMPKFQKKGLQPAYEAAGNLYNNPPSLWQGPKVAPVSDATSRSYEMGSNAATTLNGLTPGINKAFADSTNMDISSLPEYKNAASDITSRLSTQFNRALPGLRENYAANGAFGGSDQQLSEGLAAGDLSANTGSALTSLATNMFGIQAGRSNTAISSIPGLILGNTAGYNVEKDVGTAKDTRMQSELTDTVTQFNNNQMAPEDALDRYLNRISGNLTGRASDSGSTAGGVAQGAIGGYLASGNNLYGGLLGGLAGYF